MSDEAPAALVALQPGGPRDAARQLAVGAHWGDDLTPAQYVAREAHVLQHCAWLHRPGACTVLGLALADDEDIVPAATCEVYAMELAVVVAPGVLSRGTALGIASVFTQPQHRRKGLASRMLRALAASTHAAQAQALLLMSEVDPALYERCGYIAGGGADGKNIRDWVFVSAGDAALAAPGVELVTPQQLPALAARLAQLAERDLLTRGNEGAVAVLPSADQFLWHAARFAGSRKALGEPEPSSVCGATCGDAFAIWALDTEDRAVVLRILALVASEDGAATAAVLAAAVRAAASAGAPGGRALAWTTGTLHAMPAAHAWTPPSEQLARAGVARSIEPRRCLSLPMMAPLRPLVRPAAWTWVPRGVWV